MCNVCRYLHRAFGREPVPWPGTSPQLAKIRYTGSRREIIFCCGNSPYNSAILHTATTIVNASKRVGGGGGGEVEPLRFGWASDIYAPSWVCKKKRAAVAAGQGGNGVPNGGGGSAASASGTAFSTALSGRDTRITSLATEASGRRLDGGIESRYSARRQGLLGQNDRLPSRWQPAWKMATEHSAADSNRTLSIVSAASTNAHERLPPKGTPGGADASSAAMSTGAQGSACGNVHNM